MLASTGGQDDPKLQELQKQEQKLQRQRDTLEMAVSRDDAEAPNREDPACGNFSPQLNDPGQMGGGQRGIALGGQDVPLPGERPTRPSTSLMRRPPM